MLRLRRESRNLGMIVACSACNTRFRVADEKVGPRGARIKCSRCGQTFAVAPPPLRSPPAVLRAAAARADPRSPRTHRDRGLAHRGPRGRRGRQLRPGLLGRARARGRPVRRLRDPVGACRAAPAAGPAAGGTSGAERLPRLASRDEPLRPGADRRGARRAGAPARARPVRRGRAVARGAHARARRRSARSAARWGDPDASQAIEVGPGRVPGGRPGRGARRAPTRSSTPLAGEATDEAPVPPPPPPSPVPPDGRRREPAPAAERAAPTSGRRRGAEPTSRPPGPARARPGAGDERPLAGGPAPRHAGNRDVVARRGARRPPALAAWRPRRHRRRRRHERRLRGFPRPPVIFVRGVVRATREPVEGPVMVRVILERGGALLGAATATAGAVPSAEELADGHARPRDCSALRQQARLPGPASGSSRAATSRSSPCCPFPEGDVGTIRFRVEPVPGARALTVAGKDSASRRAEAFARRLCALQEGAMRAGAAARHLARMSPGGRRGLCSPRWSRRAPRPGERRPSPRSARPSATRPPPLTTSGGRRPTPRPGSGACPTWPPSSSRRARAAPSQEPRDKADPAVGAAHARSQEVLRPAAARPGPAGAAGRRGGPVGRPGAPAQPARHRGRRGAHRRAASGPPRGAAGAPRGPALPQPGGGAPGAGPESLRGDRDRAPHPAHAAGADWSRRSRATARCTRSVREAARRLLAERRGGSAG